MTLQTKNLNNASLWGFVILAGAYILPMLLSGNYYIDDNGRSISGYTDWEHDGRPLSSLMMIALNLNKHLTDTFPLPLLLSGFLLALSMKIYSDRFILTGKGFEKLIVPLGIIASPFLIENFAYRFDVLPMISSIFLSILLIAGKEKKRSIFINGLLIGAILSIYQTSINFSLSIFCCEILRRYTKNEYHDSCLSYILRSMLSFTLGFFVYFAGIVPLFLKSSGSADHPSISIESITDASLTNANHYLHIISANSPYAVSYTALVISTLLALRVALHYKKSKSIKSYLMVILISILPLISFIFSFLTLIPLDNALDAPRVMIGFSGTTLLLFTLVYYFSNTVNFRLTPVLAIPILYAFGLVYSFGNVLSSEEKLNASIIESLKIDLSRLHLNKETVSDIYLVFRGSKPSSPTYMNSVLNYPLLEKVTPNYFTNWYWPFPYLERNGIKFKYPSRDIISKTEENICALPYIDSYYYRIRYSKEVILVDFDTEPCK